MEIKVTDSRVYWHESRRRSPVTAFATLYEIVRCYGGPEEGGWWYDSYGAEGPCMPFRGEQEYVWMEEDQCWVPEGPIHVVDEPARVSLESFRCLVEQLYGELDTRHRYSCAQRSPDWAICLELSPGAMELRERPRYE